MGADLADKIKRISIEIYQTAAAFALIKGIIIADTRFEFGLDDDGTLTLMDEVLTPDSSRLADRRLPSRLRRRAQPTWLRQAVCLRLAGNRAHQRQTLGQNRTGPAPAR